ncbi:helix-turn-helix domain-containing protein [Rhodococcus sp. DMU2021]|uniref:helix-turn-helix domain-containing protein n=1 Tax=Rhodococcus sp. DMU2021 TaxID=2866997 RepID=UPI001C7CA9F9|nr:helix-turn-helix transcriptional regulator [Rhodococcus sp. DMU2021]MBX4170329.1 helix-turn-helix domain-containing protein [Rhodococcus sp. DMU2021]
MTNTTNAVQLGKALRKRRNEFELTIKEVARRSGMTDSNVLRIERGDIPQPRPETLKSLADVLGLELSDLFNLAGYVQPKTLPSFSPYLRSKYADLPESAAREMEASFVRIAAKHGYDPHGPHDGEDEKE